MSRECDHCHRKAIKHSSMCRPHWDLRKHYDAGFPLLTEDPHRIEHARQAWTDTHGMTGVEIKPLDLTNPPPCTSIGWQVWFEEYARLEMVERRMLESLCLRCPILAHCREMAIATQPYGYQGGMTPQARHSVRIIRRQKYTHLVAQYQREEEAS